MRIAFTWDDGAPQDKKLVKLHEKYDVPATLFIPTHNCQGKETLDRTDIKQIDSKLISIGAHTHNHRRLTELLEDEIISELTNNKAYLEDVTGHPCSHFCLPGGCYSKRILPIVYAHFDTVRAATTMWFRWSGNFAQTSFQLYPRKSRTFLTGSIKSKSFREAAIVTANLNKGFWEMLRVIIEAEASVQDAKIIFWGHSWEVDELGIWLELEELLQYLVNNYRDSIVSYRDLFV